MAKTKIDEFNSIVLSLARHVGTPSVHFVAQAIHEITGEERPPYKTIHKNRLAIFHKIIEYHNGRGMAVVPKNTELLKWEHR